MIVQYLLYTVPTILLIVVSAIYVYYQVQFQYWKKRKIQHTTPSFPFGDIGPSCLTVPISEAMRDLYEKYKHEKYVGIWMLCQPTLLINDPGLIKNILVKDFDYFTFRGTHIDQVKDPLSAHLFNLDGPQWRNLRVKMTPVFTSGKMKMMYTITVSIADQLVDFINKQTNDIVEFKDLTARYTTDVIASCAFGIDSGSIHNPSAVFRTMGRRLVNLPFFEAIEIFLAFLIPTLGEVLKARQVPKPVEKFLMDAFTETVNDRKVNGTKRNDFIQLLMQLMDKGHLDGADAKRKKAEDNGTDFTFNAAAAQAFVFYFAGFETSSTTLVFTFYELALYKDVQNRLREEIKVVTGRHDGQLTYEALSEMEYLDQVVSETLRMHPPASTLLRQCSRDYKLDDIVIEKGTYLQIPIVGIHMDSRYYQNPKKFDPDRFTTSAKAQRVNHTYLPFGDGPRNCIGLRFAHLQVKTAIVRIIQNFEIDVCAETQVPAPIDPHTVLMTPLGGVYLRATKTNN